MEGGIDDVGYRTTRRRAHESAAALSSTVSDMSSEPDKYGDKLQAGFSLLKINYSMMGYISALGAYRSQMKQSEDDAVFLSLFFAAAYRLTDLLETADSPDEEAFRQEYETLQHQLEQLQELAADGHNEQSSVLWQQLVMMANLLKPSRQAIQTAEAQA